MSSIASFLPRPVKTALLKARFAYRQATSSLRPLPDFVIIGAQKCGTTSLFNYLLEHPQVSPILGKEVHYFDFNPTRPISWYKAHFPIKTAGDVQVGEASPYYLFHPMVPKRMASTVPNAKLIVLLRDPVERAHSQYRHELRYQTEFLSFSEALDMEENRLQGEEQKLLTDPRYFSRAHVSQSYVARGMYAKQINRWLEYYPKEALLILNSADLFEKPAEVMGRVYDHLGLPHYDNVSFKTYNKTPGKNVMLAEDREKLVQVFKAPNRQLAELTGIDFNATPSTSQEESGS